MCKIIKKNIGSRPVFFACLSLLPLFCLYTFFIYSPAAIPYYDGQNVILTGAVTSKEISDTENINALYIDSDLNFKCYVSSLTLGTNDISIGDRITVSGQVKYFRTATNPGEFDTAKYYETRGYRFYIKASEIRKHADSHNYAKEMFFRLKVHFCNIIDENFPIEHGTVKTLLFGYKNDLEEDRTSLYKSAGISHFLVISGLHVSVAGGGVYMLLRRLGLKRAPAAFLGILLVLFYGCLVGLTISVMRAVIMYLIRLIADITKRSYDILTALAVAGTITLVSNPLWIRDSAFLYSYSAVLFVGLYITFLKSKLENRIFSKLYARHGFRYFLSKIEIALVPIIILYLGLLPLNLYFQSYSNVFSIPLNLLLGLLSGPIIFAGFAGFIFGALGLGFPAGLCDFICGILLRIIDVMSTLVSEIPFGQIIYKPPLITVYIYYILFILLLFFLPKAFPIISRITIMSTLVLVISINMKPRMYITVLDVEQGECLVVRTGAHSAIISDCGSTGRSSVSENVVAPFLQSQGFTTIDDIYISHQDADHTNGIIWLLDNQKTTHITIKRIIFPKLSSNMWNENMWELAEAAKRNNVETVAISAGTTVSYKRVQIHCLSPYENNLSGDSNQDSLVLWLQYKEFDALLTADATAETEASLCLPENITFEMLKVAHHGSRYSSSDTFLERITPLMSTISVGASNNYGHPHPDTLARLKNINTVILRTDEQGAITITPKSDSIKIKTFVN